MLISSLAGSEGSGLASKGSSLGNDEVRESLALGRGAMGLLSSFERVLCRSSFGVTVCSCPFAAASFDGLLPEGMSGAASEGEGSEEVGGNSGRALPLVVRRVGRVAHFLSSAVETRGRSHRVTLVCGLW